jgi:hypothetical protein
MSTDQVGYAMFWIILVTGWLIVAPLAAWAVARSVALAESAPRPSMADETDVDVPAEPETGTDTRTVLEPDLVAAG